MGGICNYEQNFDLIVTKSNRQHLPEAAAVQPEGLQSVEEAGWSELIEREEDAGQPGVAWS